MTKLKDSLNKTENDIIINFIFFLQKIVVNLHSQFDNSGSILPFSGLGYGHAAE